MSGEGLLADRPGMVCATALDELTDVLAYLARRRANAELMATRSPENAEWARDRQRQLEIIEDELRAGLHVGSAEAWAALQEKL